MVDTPTYPLLSWPAILVWISAFFAFAIMVGIHRQIQGRLKWADALKFANGWVARTGGTIKRVSREQPVYSAMKAIVAHRIRVVYNDQEGAEYVVTLRFTFADENWAVENLVRTRLPAASSSSEPFRLFTAAEGRERRHRGKIADVQVRFDPRGRRIRYERGLVDPPY